MPNRITGYHAHVYFDATSHDQARTLCEAARGKFAIAMGHMHEKPVGPHPTGSCQLSVPVEKFASVIPWLAMNRNGLTVFVHPDTGEVLKDHTARVMWLGASMALNIEELKKFI